MAQTNTGKEKDTDFLFGEEEEDVEGNFVSDDDDEGEGEDEEGNNNGIDDEDGSSSLSSFTNYQQWPQSFRYYYSISFC